MQGNAQVVRNSGVTVQRMDALPLPADAPAGAAGAVRVHSERVRLTAQFDAQPPTSYDSDSSAPVPDGYQAVAAVARAPLGELTVSERGEVIHAVSLLPGAEKLSPEKATAVYRDLFPRLPADPIAVGETWDETLTVRVQEGALLKPWKLRRRSTLEQVEGGVATIAVTITPLPPPSEPAFQEQLAMKCPSGAVEFDVAAGRIRLLRATVDAEIVGFRGPGSLLKLTSSHVQRLVESGPTDDLRPPRTAAAPAPPVR